MSQTTIPGLPQGLQCLQGPLAHSPSRMLVTGGAGFIGSNFIGHMLASQDDIFIVNLDLLTHAGNLSNLCEWADNPRLKFVHGDICNASLVTQLILEYDVDTIVNFAAESHVDRSIENPGELVRTNINGTFSLLEAARSIWQSREAGYPADVRTRRFHQVSTDEVFGSLDELASPFTENHPFLPNSPYSASKAAADHLVRAYFQTFRLPVTTTHCSNNFGCYQYPEKLIPLVITNALSLAALPLYGDGLHTRDWLCVADHVQAIESVIRYGSPGESYNVGGDNPKTNLEVVLAICYLLDELRPRADGATYCNQIAYIKDRPGHDRRYAVNASKIRTAFGWQPQCNFEIALRNTVTWYLENDAWVKCALNGEHREWVKLHYNS